MSKKKYDNCSTFEDWYTHLGYVNKINLYDIFYSY